jgi:hypothetical protein
MSHKISPTIFNTQIMSHTYSPTISNTTSAKITRTTSLLESKIPTAVFGGSNGLTHINNNK